MLNRWRKGFLAGGLFAAAFILIAPPGASADVAVTDAGTGSLTIKSEIDGYQFTVGSKSLLVSALGFFQDPGTTGLNNSHEVAIWDSNGNIVVTATVKAGVVDPLISGSNPANGGFRYDSSLYSTAAENPLDAISSIILSANSVYTIASQNGPSTGDSVTGDNVRDISFSPTFSSDITNEVAKYPGSANGFNAPPNGDGSCCGTAYLGPSFQYSQAPEPSSMLLPLAIGIVLLVRRRRICLAV